MKLSSIIIAVLIVASWGFNSAIGKIGVMQVGPLAFLTVRFILAALIFLPFARVNKNQLRWLFIITLLLNVGHMGFIFVAIKLLPASSASVIQQCEVPLAFVVSYFLAGEKINFQQLVGILVAFAGIICIFGIPDINVWGLAAGLISGLFWAFAQLAFKKSPKFSPSSFLAYTSLFSVPFLGAASYLFEQTDYVQAFSSADYRFWLSLSYQVLILGVAMMMWQRVVAENGINKVTPITLLHIVFGIMGGMIFFDETLNLPMISGALLIMTGVGLTVLPKIKFHINLTLAKTPS